MLKNDDDSNALLETKDITNILYGNQNETNDEELNMDNSNNNHELIQQ